MTAQNIYNDTLTQLSTQDSVKQFVESTTPVAASATVNGATRDTRQDGRILSRFLASVFANQAGNVFVDISMDGTTWRQRANAAVSTNTLASLDVVVPTRFVRVRFVNSTTANTVFELYSSLRAV
jgi:hypothetical protein